MQTETLAPPAPFWNICRRVYLVWAILLLIGFGATQFHQEAGINWLWLVISLIGLGYMVHQTRLPEFRTAGLAHLYFVGLVWTLVIALGMVLSVLPFMGLGVLAPLSRYLGVFWLFQMGLGHWLNGMVDPPRYPYWMTGGIQILAGIVCLVWGLEWQFWVAGGVGALAMLLLIPLHPVPPS
ncbi:MAG: hypothetical protein Q6L68_15845 [Thermostichus sp. DG02_5_bins_236]